MEKESIFEDLKNALLKYGYSMIVVERILKWYSSPHEGIDAV